MIKNTASKLKLTALAACMAAGLAANPANATITIYEKDGFKYKIKGDWQIQFNQNPGEDENLDVEFDDLEIRHLVTYDVGGGVTALGQVHTSWNRNGDATSNNTFEEAFIGFDFGGHRIVYGSTNSAGDEFGVEKAYEGLDGGIKDDAFNFIADAGDDIVRYDGSFGPVSVAASYELETTNSDDLSFFDIFASVKVAGVKLAVAYQDSNKNDDEEGVGVSASYAAGPVDFGVDFSSVDTGADDDTEILNVVAGVKVGPTGYIGAGYVNQDNGSTDVTGWYANYTYKFAKAKNVRLIAEILDTDVDDSDLGYFLGTRILF